MTKDNPGEFDCYQRAGTDEPLFVLRSTDPSAPRLVRQWADEYELRKGIQNSSGDGPGLLDERQQRKVDEARECARAMEAWRQANAEPPA